jgi:hypothetical protein
MQTTFKIIVEYIHPPIPYRHMDWIAFYDGDEEAGPRGEGSTMKLAVEDLLDQTG